MSEANDGKKGKKQRNKQWARTVSVEHIQNKVLNCTLNSSMVHPTVKYNRCTNSQRVAFLHTQNLQRRIGQNGISYLLQVQYVILFFHESNGRRQEQSKSYNAKDWNGRTDRRPDLFVDGCVVEGARWSLREYSHKFQYLQFRSKYLQDHMSTGLRTIW
jgi:hypothetical protein